MLNEKKIIFNYEVIRDFTSLWISLNTNIDFTEIDNYVIYCQKYKDYNLFTFGFKDNLDNSDEMIPFNNIAGAIKNYSNTQILLMNLNNNSLFKFKKLVLYAFQHYRIFNYKHRICFNSVIDNYHICGIKFNNELIAQNITNSLLERKNEIIRNFQYYKQSNLDNINQN